MPEHPMNAFTAGPARFARGPTGPGRNQPFAELLLLGSTHYLAASNPHKAYTESAVSYSSLKWSNSVWGVP